MQLGICNRVLTVERRRNRAALVMATVKLNWSEESLRTEGCEVVEFCRRPEEGNLIGSPVG